MSFIIFPWESLIRCTWQLPLDFQFSCKNCNILYSLAVPAAGWELVINLQGMIKALLSCHSLSFREKRMVVKNRVGISLIEYMTFQIELLKYIKLQWAIKSLHADWGCPVRR